MVSALVSFHKWMKGTNKSQDYSNITPWKLSHAPCQQVQGDRERALTLIQFQQDVVWAACVEF